MLNEIKIQYMEENSINPNEDHPHEVESLDEGGQEVIFEEEVDLDEEESELPVENKPGHPPHSHVILWVGVALCIIGIMVGWIYFTKQSFMSIDAKVNPEAPQSAQELQDQLKTTFTELGTMLEDMNTNVDKLKATDEARQKEAAILRAAGKSVGEELKKE